MSRFIENYLTPSQRACLYASSLVYGHDESETLMKGEFYRHSFDVDGMPYQYVRSLSNDNMAVFFMKPPKGKLAKRFIIAFRGTDNGNPERFLGLSSTQMLTETQRTVLTPDERTELLAKFCPAEAAVGCGETDFYTLPSKRGFAELPAWRTVQDRLRLTGGDLLLDRASDCNADYLITLGEEDESRLHRFQAQALETLCDAILRKSASVEIYVTGHSLGGSLAAFAVANYAQTHDVRGKNQFHVVLFSAGSGKTGRSAEAIQNLLRLKSAAIGCNNTTGILNRDRIVPTKVTNAEAVLRASSQVHPNPVPRSWISNYKYPAWWSGLNIIMFRETCDVVSSVAAGWWPTVSFTLRGSLVGTTFCTRFAELDATYHGLMMYMSDESNEKIQGPMTWHVLSNGNRNPSHKVETDRHVIGEKRTGGA